MQLKYKDLIALELNGLHLLSYKVKNNMILRCFLSHAVMIQPHLINSPCIVGAHNKMLESSEKLFVFESHTVIVYLILCL